MGWLCDGGFVLGGYAMIGIEQVSRADLGGLRGVLADIDDTITLGGEVEAGGL